MLLRAAGAAVAVALPPPPPPPRPLQPPAAVAQVYPHCRTMQVYLLKLGRMGHPRCVSTGLVAQAGLLLPFRLGGRGLKCLCRGFLYLQRKRVVGRVALAPRPAAPQLRGKGRGGHLLSLLPCPLLPLLPPLACFKSALRSQQKAALGRAPHPLLRPHAGKGKNALQLLRHLPFRLPRPPLPLRQQASSCRRMERGGWGLCPQRNAKWGQLSRHLPQKQL